MRSGAGVWKTAEAEPKQRENGEENERRKEI